jgi:putative hemolysin
MLSSQTQTCLAARKSLAVSFARDESEVREVQRLRYKIFAEEMGAKLQGHESGLDQDIFDPYCEHLLVRATGSNEVVGTYRILNHAQAKKTGGLYSDGEFDLSRLDPLRPSMVEVGRSCVHPDYRSGATIALLWHGLALYMERHRYQYLIGCASIPMKDGGHVAASIYNKIRQQNLSPNEYRVFPYCELPLDALNGNLDAPAPPLLKGYLRLGAYVCGAPAWDSDFNTADLLILLPMYKINPLYAKHLFRK